MTCDGTIAAIATAPGRAGIAVVRVSGDRAFAIAERLTGRRPVAGRIAFARLAFDEAVVLAFAAPHSYTGEDVVEFQCHGGAVAPKRVLAETLKAGARLARHGEFTERALLNGRLTYEQAEGVIDLIDAKTDRAAEEAFRGLAGTRESELRDLYTELLDLSATAELALDVDESDLPDGFWAGLDTRRRGLVAAFTDSLRRARQGRILRDGALVVLAGRPNAGKSSLMNALLGTDRAIVSSTPGTTRDSIEEWLDLDGWPVRLVDTAGLRETADAIESEGVERARDLIARADVVLDLDEGRGDERTIPVHAKCDLGRGEGLNVSSITGEGLDALRAALAERVAACAETRQLPERAAALLEIRYELDRTEDDPVLFANVLRSAAEKLGAHLGATYSEDLLERLFSRFCVGK